MRSRTGHLLLMRAALFAATTCTVTACESTRERSTSGPRTSGDASVLRDAGIGSTDGDLDDDGSDAAGDNADGSALDAASSDAVPLRDAGNTTDAGNTRDGGNRDAGFNADAASPPDSGPPPAQVSITTSGCTADFGGDLIVSYNGSIAVGSLRGSSLAASLQFELQGQTGAINLSSQHRIQTGIVINLVTWSTWTNIAQDPDAIIGQIPDPITGSLFVRTYEPASGVIDLDLNNVTIQNVSDQSFCTLDGRVETDRLGR